jgi:hypothetical protein
MTANEEKAPPPEYEELSLTAAAGDEATGQPTDALAQAAAAIEGDAASGPTHTQHTVEGRPHSLYVQPRGRITD